MRRKPSPYPAYDETARCRRPGTDIEAFHPGKGENNATTAAAKRLCNGWPSDGPCPFRDGCREYGVTHAVHGIWGGWAEDERKAERKRRRIIPEPLSMALAAAVPPPTKRPRADAAALNTCELCGREMTPGNLPRHRREQHERKAA